MDRISHLPEEIISKILPFLPTRDVMRTMPHHYGNFRRFVDISLLSRAAAGQVLQSLSLKSHHNFTHDDVEIWLRTARASNPSCLSTLELALPLGHQVPSLRRLSLIFEGYRSKGDVNLVIDTPSLKSLQIVDRSGVYPDGCCFHRLKHLEVCTCKSEWLLLFMRVLQDSPVLKVITINQCHPVINPRTRHWNQPGSVPRCFSSNLEIFEWIKYEGKQYEKKLSTYILKTAVLLKKASFTARSDDYKEKLLMIQELSFSQRASSTSISYSVKIIEEDMDRISLLPNDFLLHILSLLPTKDVPATSLLSKRWLNLWKLVSKLNYIERDDNADHVGFVRFSNAVCESLVSSTVIRLRSLSDCLRACSHVELVVLKLQNVSLVDVQFPVCFKLLKTLHLDEVIYLDDETPKKLLSCCPILQVLDLDRAENDNVRRFAITVPSLQRFDYYGRPGSVLVMNTPSLKYFKTLDYACECMIEYLPEILVAHVEVTCSNTDDILRSLASVKRLLLCLSSERKKCRERELASFVLKHAKRLKVATFSPLASTQLDTTLEEKYRMITELARLPRGSTECELVFG
ncbi:hypothetical protein DY000_02001253 [Brassica cretica]|uniref:F-box domain-containing protein n=1 Tax=Brassica cretica TaxID=69181 RepID=A0ABQ7CF64_BRACR|nr:hypothetical protein DY000_02001253 [Brassica cretica]